MKLKFFNRPASEQALIIRETAARRGLLPVMVEKDFWVSWTLAALFTHPEFGSQLVFKGGTSLSKVFGVIGRFSEDIDLSVSPAFLGISEESVEQADTRNQRTQRMQELETACIERVTTWRSRGHSGSRRLISGWRNWQLIIRRCAQCFWPNHRRLKM